MLEKLKEIEENYPVEKIKAKGLCLWPYLRIYFSEKLFHSTDAMKYDTKLLKIVIRTFYKGFFRLFKSYKYWAFSNVSNRIIIKNKRKDKLIEPIFDHLQEEGLIWEMTLNNHFKTNEYYKKNVISKNILRIFEVIYSRLFLRKIKIENENILIDILKKYDITIDYLTLSKKYLAQYFITKKILKFNPQLKAFFISCYYTDIGYIKALKEARIPVIELQHGLINRQHRAYNVFKDIDNQCYPDYLLTFGQGEKHVFNNDNYFINPENVIPVGHYYLEYLKNNFTPLESLTNKINQYNKVVTVTSQDPLEDKLIHFLTEVVKQDASIAIIFVPRRKKEADYIQLNLTDNFIFEDALNCYEKILHAHFHSTVYSTCAAEAIALGKQNIMINIDNLSLKFFKNLTQNKDITDVANTPDEFVAIINQKKILSPDFITNQHKDIVMPDYEKNIDTLLNKII